MRPEGAVLAAPHTGAEDAAARDLLEQRGRQEYVVDLVVLVAVAVCAGAIVVGEVLMLANVT